MAKNLFQLKQDQVYIKEWLAFHPYKTASSTDSYYLKLCKEIYSILTLPKHSSLALFLDKDDLKVLACFLTGYFEDVISDIGIWKTFTSGHFKLYNKYLPFYQPEEYFPDEINVEDIYFLIWYFLSAVYYRERTFSPVFETIINLGDDIYPVFDREYEIAPENTKLKEFLQIEPDEFEFYKIRDKLKWLGLDSYLFYFQKMECDIEIAELLEEHEDDEHFFENMNGFIYDTIDYYVNNKVSPLLALNVKDWMSGVLGEDHLFYNEIKKLGPKKRGVFLYLKEDRNYFYFRHVATETIIPVVKRSFGEESFMLTEKKSVVYIGFVKWKGEWWFSGTYAVLEYDSDTIEREKNSIQSRKLFSENQTEKQKEILELQKRAYMKLTGGHLIAFLKEGSRFDLFMAQFNENYIDELDIPKKRKKKAKQELKTKTLMANESDTFAENENSPVMVFFNEKSGIEIITGSNELIPDPRNPDYDKNSDRNEILELISSDSISKEFVEFIINEYQLTDIKFPDDDGSLLLDNLDFMMRFNKREYYFSKPELSFA